MPRRSRSPAPRRSRLACPVPARPPTAPRTSFARSHWGAPLLALGARVGARPGDHDGHGAGPPSPPAPAAAPLIFLVPLAIDVLLTATGSRSPTPRATGSRHSVGPVPRLSTSPPRSSPARPTRRPLRTELGTPATPRAPLRSGRCRGRPELLRDGEGWAVETFTAAGHARATHVDAPWPWTGRSGCPARPSTSCRWNDSFCPGVVVDTTDKPDGERSRPPRSRRC